MASKFRALGTGRPPINSALPMRLAGSACIALFISTGLLWHAVDSWNSARSNLQIQQGRLKQAQTRDRASLQKVEMADYAKNFMEQAREKRLTAGQWVGRGVEIREARAKRKAAVEFLYQAQSYRGQIFSAEEFDVAATDAGAGLFGDVPQDFQVLLKGRAMFRVSQ